MDPPQNHGGYASEPLRHGDRDVRALSPRPTAHQVIARVFDALQGKKYARNVNGVDGSERKGFDMAPKPWESSTHGNVQIDALIFQGNSTRLRVSLCCTSKEVPRKTIIWALR